jgi:hypothetical protein
MAQAAKAADFMGAVAGGTVQTLSQMAFIDGVFCEREGDFHRRLLWVQCISDMCVRMDCPAEVKNADPHWLAMEALLHAEHKTVPSQPALLEALERRRAHHEALQRKAVLAQSPPAEARAAVHHRRQQLRIRAEAQRAEARPQPSRAEDYQIVINATSRTLLTQVPSLRPRVLLDFRLALAFAQFDRATGLKRSLDHFKGGAEILAEMITAMLQTARTSVSEYTMAHWKLICDRAMSKWRPYAKKSAAAIGLSEIRFLANGSSFFKPTDATKLAVTAAEALSPEQGQVVLADVRQRVRRSSPSDAVAREQWQRCLQRCQEIQLPYRAALLAALEQPWVHGRAALAVTVAAGEKGFLRFEHLRQFGLTKPEDFVELATMSPLGLLQLVVSYHCSDAASPSQFWPGLLDWRSQLLKASEAPQLGERPEDKMLQLLAVVSRCPRCRSEKTKHTWRKTRSADEAFQFLIYCFSCRMPSVVD